MKNKFNYGEERTTSVKRYNAFEKDFENLGDFKIEAYNDGLTQFFGSNCLCVDHLPGRWNGRKWIRLNDKDDSYEISIVYRSKYQIFIIIGPLNAGKNMQRSQSFIKRAGKKFGLRNGLVETYGEEFFPNLKVYLWKHVIELMKHYGNSSLGLSISWNKTMTLTQAKKLFNYLKIEINFPS